MHRILVQFAHPARSRSNINQAVRAAIEELTGVTVNDLYAQYPDFLIDVSREQALCAAHDVIVFQHPFYWYSTPAILKEWQDLVLEHGWAYGTSGTALRGKLTFQLLSAGGDATTYQRGGYNGFTIEELTSPYQATANLCGMTWLPPLAITGVHRGIEPARLEQHASDCGRILEAIRDSRIDVDFARTQKFLNADLDRLIRER